MRWQSSSCYCRRTHCRRDAPDVYLELSWVMATFLASVQPGLPPPCAGFLASFNASVISFGIEFLWGPQLTARVGPGEREPAARLGTGEAGERTSASTSRARSPSWPSCATARHPSATHAVDLAQHTGCRAGRRRTQSVVAPMRTAVARLWILRPAMGDQPAATAAAHKRSTSFIERRGHPGMKLREDSRTLEIACCGSSPRL